MSQENDGALARTAVELGILTAGELAECLRAQEDLKRRGREVPLEQVLLKRRYVNSQTLQGLLAETARRTPSSSGRPSGRRPPAGDLPSFSRYRVEEKVGEGGMAVVYRAVDRELGRKVALKVLKESTRSPGDRRARFQREGRAVARLSHPNVVAVYDVGEEGGRPFLVMEYVPGRSLEAVLAEGRPRFRAAAELLQKVAQGVACAHEAGIVHRDLKPANVLVTASGEPKVADFGLAHVEDAQSALTRTGAAIGTPYYMAPEQVAGSAGRISARTDVFALGTILYEALAGRRPFPGKTASEVYARITAADPPPLSRLARSVPRELEWIALRALEKDPARRYADAGAFAGDLGRWLAGLPVEARPVSALGRLWRRAVRRRAVVLSAAVALLASLCLAGVAIHGAAGRARVEKELERQSREDEAAKERSEAEREAHRLLESGRPALDAAFLYLYDERASYEELVRRVDEGRGRIEKAVARAPWLALGHHLAGRAWELTGWPDRAEDSYREAVRRDPDFAPAHLALGRLLVTRAFLANLGGSSREQAERRPEARRLAEEAAREIDRSLALGGGADDEVARTVAEAMLAWTRDEDAAFERLLEDGTHRFAERPGVEELHWLAGIRATSVEESLAAYGRAISARPKYPIALFCRGQVRLHSQDLAGAISDWDEAVRFWPRFAEAYSNRGWARALLGRIDEAIGDYDRAIEIQPDFAGAHYNRGLAWKDKDELDRAFADFDRATVLAPDLAPAWLNKGSVRQKMGDLEDALSDMDEAARLDPSFAEAFAARALVRWERKDLDGAIADFEKALGLAPDNPILQAAVRELLRQAKEARGGKK
ncbi:MAG: protein kinase [Planctomycetes bacterium]|nr:protein kinase [Planctomycetota bacterium]